MDCWLNCSRKRAYTNKSRRIFLNKLMNDRPWMAWSTAESSHKRAALLHCVGDEHKRQEMLSSACASPSLSDVLWPVRLHHSQQCSALRLKQEAGSGTATTSEFMIVLQKLFPKLHINARSLHHARSLSSSRGAEARTWKQKSEGIGRKSEITNRKSLKPHFETAAAEI